MKENWGLQAADLAQERNVFVQKYGLPVRTSLTRADEIEYALETQLLNMPKENFFAMQNLEEPAEDVAQKAVKSVAKSALHSAVPGSMAARWLSKTPFFRGFGATGVSLARQSGAAVLKDTARAATAMGLGADTQTQRTQEIKQKLQEKGLPAALLPLEKSKADAQAIGQSITLKNWLEPNFAQEKLKALHKEQQKVDLFNQKVRFITEHFLQRTGLARNEKDGFWYDLGGGAASVLGSIGALVLTRNPYVGAVIFGAAEGQSSYEAAVEAGIAPQDAYWLGKANGAWIGATELIGDKFFSKLLYGKGILGKYSQRILEQSKKTSKLRQNISVAALSMAEGGFIEAAQETTQNMGTDLIHKYSAVEDKKIGQIIKDALYAGMLAFVLGGLPGGMAGMGAFRKYTENIKDELAAAGVEEKEAENLARETALTAIGSEFVGDSIKAVSAEINSPLTAEDRNPAEFARVLTQAQNREIDQTAWQVAEKVEQESLQAGVSPKVAAATGQVAQALTNGIYRLAKLTPKEQAHFNISILKGAQNRQVPAFNQAAAAMYKSPAKSLAEFVAFARKNKGNPKEDNKSYYRFATQENLKIEIPFERAVHIEQRHHLTAEELEIVENAFVKAEYALLLPKVGEYGGRQLKLKIDTKIGKMGSVLEILPNGRVFLNTAFFDSDANIDNWAKENLPNTPGEIPVFVGGDTNSIADIVQEIKGKNGSSAAFNQAAAAMYKSPHKEFSKFYETAQSNKGKKQSYYTYTTKSGIDMDIPSDTILHDKKHPEMDAKMWANALSNLDNIKHYYLVKPRVGIGVGAILHLADDFGAEITIQPNNRILLNTAFKSTSKGIEAWINKAKENARMSAPLRRGQASQSEDVVSSRSPIYSLADIVQEIKGKNGSSAAFNQAAAAMYRNPAKSLAEFVDKVQKQKAQGKGSYFSFYQKDGVEIHLTNTAVWHDKKHTEMTPEMWEKAASNIENIEDYTFSSEKLKQGQTGTILLKINASGSKFGIALDVFENGRIFAESVFTGTDATLDQWLQEQRSRNKKIKAAGSPAPHFIGVGQALQKSKDVLSGQPSIYSLADIVQEIKPQNTYFQGGFHGSPHRFDKFSLDHIGSGEGAQDGESFVIFDDKAIEIKKTFYQKIEKDLFEVDDEIKKAVENDVSQCVQGKLPVWKEIELGLPSIALKQVGIPDYQLRLKQKTIKKDVQSKHAVKLSTIQNLPSLLADPLLILKSETESGSFVLALKDTDLNGKRIIAAIDPEGVIEINYIDSVYGKDDPYWFKKQVEKGNLLYIDEKEAQKESSHLYLRGVPYKASDNRILTKEDIVKAQALKTYHQTPADPRGSVEIDEQAHEAVIRIFENADPSTIVHELAHIYLTMLHESAKVSMDEDFQHLMQDIDTWLGEPNGADGSYSVEQQEQFARGFESYLAQGKAPNKELENVFEKFAAWLAEIYESVKDFLQISPEVSSIFDRLLTTQEPIKRSKIGQKVQAAKELAQAMKKGFGQDIDGVSVADMKELLRTLSTRKPPEPKEHLLKDLRKYGADYANAAAIDKEAYKNARVFDKKGGVGDHPAQWLTDRGYLSEQDAQTYEDQSKLDELAYQMIERALGGEKIYKLQDQPRAEERAAYEENLNTILEIFPDIPTAKESLRAIAVLESQGYRAVDKKDLQDLQRMLNLLGKMTERLEQEELKAKAGELERKALKIQEDAKRLKQRISEELDKRHLEHKQNMQNLLKNAHTPQEIYAAAEGVLGQLEKLWKQTEEGKQEHRRLNVPDTNWEQVKVKLLADFTRISQGAHQEVAQAQKALASFFGRILSEEEAQAKEKAEAVLKKADLESKYVRAMQSAMSGVVHISTADIAKYTAFLARSTQRHRLLTKRNVEQFIERAREIQLRNYKKYMAGKLTALFNRKIFEKAGTAKRLKYNELAARFLTEAGNIWKGSQVQAQSLYAARLKTIDPQNPPDGFTALINAVLSLKAEPDMAGAQDYYDVYQTALSAIRGDALQKRMEVLRRITQEQTLRVALAAQLDERKLGKGEIAYVLRGGVDLQTFISMVFGKGKFDKYEQDVTIRQVDLTLQDWLNPTQDFILPPLPEEIAQQLGIENKNVLLKKNIIEKNKSHHKEVPLEEYNDILEEALYNSDYVMQVQPKSKPNYFTFVKEMGNKVLVLEINNQKENFEVVGFFKVSLSSLQQYKNKNTREGGRFLITKGNITQGAAGLSALPSDTNSIAGKEQNFKSEQYRQVLRALEKIINGSEEETIKNLRPDFEQYGGTPDVTLVFGDNKKGLQHIAQKHGADILTKVLQAVINGRVEKFTPNKKTLHIKQENIVAVLSLDENGKQKSWLLTGWDETSEIGKEKRTGANGQVSTDSAATQTLPTFSRQDLGAVLKSINSIADIDRNFKAQQYEIDFREELSPENEQMQAAVFKHQSRQKLVVAAMKAYGLNSADQVIDKITELQNDKMQIVSYADIKDEQSGEMIARVFKNGKVYTDSGAKKQTITREEIITFWLWDQDHVFDENGQDYGLSGRLTRAYGRAQLEQMFAKLTPQDKAFGTALQQLLADVHQLESQTHRRIYGFALPHKAHYFPSVTDRNDDSIDYKQQIVDNAKAPSFIKERVKSGRPAQQRISPVKLVLRHLDRAGEFIFEAEKYAKLRRVVNNTALKNAFENKFGQSDGKALYKKLQDLIVQQGPTPLKTKDELFDLTEKAFNGWVKAALGAKIMVGVKQFASSISFAEQMPVHLWAKWFAEGLSRPFKTAQYMKELSPYIQVRYESGGVNEAVARAMTLDEISPVATRWNNLTNLLLLNTRMGDKASLIFGGYPYMKYLTDVKKLTPQEAARQFEKQAVRTLQSSLKANLSMAQADANSLPWRLMLTFKNQQMQYVRRLADGYVQYKNKEISLAQFGKTVWLYLVANPLVYTMLSLGYLADDDDERQKDILRLFSSPVSQFFDAWPFYGAAAEYAMQAAYQLLQGEKISAPNRIGTPAVDDFYKDVSKAVKTVNAEDVEATEFVQVWLEFAKYIGLPLGTFGNMLGGVKDLSQGKPTRGGLRVLGFTKKRAEKITGQED